MHHKLTSSLITFATASGSAIQADVQRQRPRRCQGEAAALGFDPASAAAQGRRSPPQLMLHYTRQQISLGASVVSAAYVVALACQHQGMGVNGGGAVSLG